MTYCFSLFDSSWESIQQKAIPTGRCVQVLVNELNDKFITDQLTSVHHVLDLLTKGVAWSHYCSQHVTCTHKHHNVTGTHLVTCTQTSPCHLHMLQTSPWAWPFHLLKQTCHLLTQTPQCHQYTPCDLHTKIIMSHVHTNITMAISLAHMQRSCQLSPTQANISSADTNIMSFADTNIMSPVYIIHMHSIMSPSHTCKHQIIGRHRHQVTCTHEVGADPFSLSL